MIPWAILLQYSHRHDSHEFILDPNIISGGPLEYVQCTLLDRIVPLFLFPSLHASVTAKDTIIQAGPTACAKWWLLKVGHDQPEIYRLGVFRLQAQKSTRPRVNLSCVLCCKLLRFPAWWQRPGLGCSRHIDSDSFL
jgi:hypothetical protein